MIVLSDSDIDRLLPLPQTMPDIVARIEEAYGDWGRQQAINRPRTDMVSEHGEGTYRVFKSMEGCVPAMGIVALRTNSLRQSWHPSGTGVTKRLEQTAGSLIFLFSTESGELLAICPDERLQRMRVGATSAVAARRLAPERPLRMALLGSSGQARYHLLAMVASLQVTRVDVYSPNAEHAQQLVDDVRPFVACSVEHAPSAEAAVKDADLVVSATSSVTPTVRLDWLKPGCHVTCVKTAELGLEVIDSMDRVVVNSQKGFVDNYLIGHGDAPYEATDPVHLLGIMPKTDPDVDWTRYPALKDVIAGRAAGRETESERTCFLNNVGLGIQFAAIGSLVYERAAADGVGREVTL